MSSFELQIGTQSGCNNLATKRISKTASINSSSKPQSATRLFVWFIIVLMAASVIETIDARPTQRHMGKHHHANQTHRLRQMTKRSHGSNHSPDDWNNPCGGTFDGSKPGTRMPKDSALPFLRNATRTSYRISTTNDKQIINIQDFSAWDKHKVNYKFLPKLTRNSSIALKRWHRNMQTYVATFSYLYQVQRTYDHKTQNGYGISEELKLLLDQARSVLCEIESTINRTSSEHSVKFNPVPQSVMDQRLKFATRIHSKNSKDVQMVYEVDLKYAKHYFINFLNTMTIILRKNTIRKNQSESDSRSVSSNEVNTSRSQSVANKKHRLANGKKAQSKKAKRGRLIKNNSLSAA